MIAKDILIVEGRTDLVVPNVEMAFTFECGEGELEPILILEVWPCENFAQEKDHCTKGGRVGEVR